MRRRSSNVPQWECQVNQTIQELKNKSKCRSLRSHYIYECICIFINDHLKKRIFSYATISLYFQHLKSFSTWMHETENVIDIEKLNASHLRSYFSYLENERNYKRTSLEGVQTPLMRFFRSMRLRRLIKKIQCKIFISLHGAP